MLAELMMTAAFKNHFKCLLRHPLYLILYLSVFKISRAKLKNNVLYFTIISTLGEVSEPMETTEGGRTRGHAAGVEAVCWVCCNGMLGNNIPQIRLQERLVSGADVQTPPRPRCRTFWHGDGWTRLVRLVHQPLYLSRHLATFFFPKNQFWTDFGLGTLSLSTISVPQWI